MGIIQDEYEDSKKYMLATKTIIYRKEERSLAILSRDNVARAEAMILNDAAYLRSSDKNAGPHVNKSGIVVYGGSTAYWMCRLKDIVIGGKTVDSIQYAELIEQVVRAIDRENSTHLNSDTVGFKQISKRIADIDKDDLVRYLKKPEETGFRLISIIAEKTVVNKKNGSGKRDGSRNNPSFASKFCHYACFYFFEGEPEQDNYPIYDSILRINLPHYMRDYGIQIKRVNDLDNYSVYRQAIDDVIKKSGTDMSRNGFDHLVWYYHKGRR